MIYDPLKEFSMTRFILKSMLAALTASLVALPLQARDTIQIVVLRLFILLRQWLLKNWERRQERHR